MLAPLIFMVLGAIASVDIPDPDQPPTGVQQLLERKHVFLVGTIIQPPERLLGGKRVRLRLEAFKEDNNWHAVSGNMLLNIKQCDKQWSMGQRLIGRIRLRAVRNFNNPGGFDYRQYLANEGIWVRGYARSDADLVPLGKPKAMRVGRFLSRIRRQSSVFLEAWLPTDHASLYRALLLGQRFTLSLQIRELLYNAGVGHLLAISGLHLGMVAGFAFFACQFVFLRVPALVGRWGARPSAALIAFPVAFGYALLTGMHLSALRAILMLAFFTLALVFSRGRDLVNSLLLAAFVILVLYPEALFGASFQLSFIAVAALLIVVPRLPVPGTPGSHEVPESTWRRRGRRLYQYILATVVVSIYTAPVVLAHFHRVSLAGLLANLLVVPLVCFLVLPAGLLALCLLPLSVNLAGFLLTMGSLGLNIVILLATRFGSLPWATLWPGTPSMWQLVLVYCILTIPLVNIQARIRVSLLLGGIVLFTISWMISLDDFCKPAKLSVTYLDVGQGSAAVVEFPKRTAVLVDGGGFYSGAFDVGRHLVAPYLWHRRIDHLEVMVLSHAHPDHFKGLQFVTSHFCIKQFWHNNIATDDPNFSRLITTLARKKIPILGPKELTTARQIQGVDITVLHPPPDLFLGSATPVDNVLNEYSLVFSLKYKEISFLFPGDIEKVAEGRLAALSKLETVDVLLAPHHGSRTSSSLQLLRRLRPRIAVFSVGFDNRFRLPADEVLQRYRTLGTQIYRTDQHGAITISTDGHNLQVETFIKNPSK
jgi:competence protein ComEC